MSEDNGSILDTGLTKEGLKEVIKINEKSYIRIKEDIERNVSHITKEQELSARRIDRLFKSISEISETLKTIEFKHNWKTAMWVFIGSATPVAIGFIAMFMSNRVNG